MGPRQPDGILVSAETVKDFQLRPGDPLKLRLQNGHTKEYQQVQFHYLGVGKEFPTAPRDSFLIANTDYVAKQTGSNAIGAFLVNTAGSSPKSVATRLRALLGPASVVTDITTTRKIVGSSLTAVDLSGLTRVELSFAVVLAGVFDLPPAAHSVPWAYLALVGVIAVAAVITAAFGAIRRGGRESISVLRDL